MLPLQLGWLSFLLLKTGCLHVTFFQPASSAGEEYEALESSISYEVQSFGAWYIWPCLSLFLAVVLVCFFACCLQGWLKWQRLCSSPRTLAVFALSDADTAYENDVTPWMPPKIHLHLPVCELSSSDFSYDVGPPSYNEIMKPQSDLNSEPIQDAGAAAALNFPQ
ncbi:transmembrane protein 207 [Sceloporus undulatus]|uniref:transmembrane protein 207 n=1 Tax=Sceloporus undulatus TaxID=8520 RepID=UPI001C4B3292|nr:transmembrane protein 207 [Sceloporus undulatus]XP_042316692.1 transmembrane protein 207 [Sceloporus undulatus]XP_042316693.1 transmembrane protein 207 [Sceloporus undulatus]